MGCLAPPAEPVGVSLIERALLEKNRGNQLAFVKLQHTLARGRAAEVTELLYGLSHFAASHLSSEAYAHPQCIRELMKAALEYNFGARQNASEDYKPTPSLLEAYQQFVLNLVSANSTLVEHALTCFAKRAFMLPLEERAEVMECIHIVLPSFLHMHPQANDVLARVILDKHPHPIRKAPDLVSYTRSILEVALECRSQSLRCSILFTVIEKLIAVQSLVPANVYSVTEEPASEDDEMTDVDDMLPPSKVTFAPTDEEQLSAEAEKIDAILMEVFDYLRKAAKSHGDKFLHFTIEPIVHAVERFVIPVGGGRFVPYVLQYAISLAGQGVSEEVCERFRHAFFDASVSEDLRLKSMVLSSALVSRCRTVSPQYCLQWMRSIATWLNRYSDPFINCESCDLSSDFDGDAHKLFYSSVCSLLKTITLRTDAFDSTLTLSKDALSRMRLIRVLSSPLNPIVAVPSEIMHTFCKLALANGGLDIVALSPYSSQITDKKARYGMSNEFEHVDLLEPLQLRLSKEEVSSFYRNSCTDQSMDKDSSDACDAALNKKLGEAFASASAPRLLSAVAADTMPMVLSSS